MKPDPAKRSRARVAARTSARPAPKVAKAQELSRVLLDLQTHQEELRQQNDELRNTQLELESARDRYSDLYEMAPLPHLTLNRAGIVTEANDTCLTFLGLPLERLLRHSFASLVLPAWRLVLRQSMGGQRNRPRTTVLHLRMQAAVGDVPVELHMRPTANQLTYTAIVDLSERERTEAERRALQVEAEVARAASAARDRFLAGLSHELRTPLTPVVAAISGLEPRLARGALSMNELRDFLTMVRRNLDYEVRLIDDLLDASRLTFGKLVLERRNIDLHAVLCEAVALVADEAERKGLQLKVELEAGSRHHHVKADVLRMRQVFWNLLRNALKFTPVGGTVSVRSYNVGRLVGVEVRDTGAGIAPGDLTRVFDRFAQTAGGAQEGGLGLGLAIVHGIVEAHGGRVRAASEGIGKGACFTVELASVTPPARQPRPAAPTTPPPLADLAGADGAGRRILLVDDHEETAAILAQLLRGQGYEVKVAHTMRAALSAGGPDTDLIITDIGLPDGSGLELLQKLRRRREVPAIALSGYGRQEDLERSRAAGFALHLVKPVEFPRLLRAIHEVGG